MLCGRALYLQKNNGAIYKISRLTGRVRWKTKARLPGRLVAGVRGRSVYAVVLARGKGIKGGRVMALDAKNGRVRWSRKLPSRAESSPLVASGRVYFGTEDGTVYALRARDGAVRWRYKADGAVKGGLALNQGRLFFGDYGGKVHAIRARDGSPIWKTSSAGSAFGLKAGRFYSTPATAYGRVYIGSLDGFVYSFAASNGKLAWRHRTGSYVYSSPAVASVPGAGPTVYIGSYDGRLYAFNARSGACAGRTTPAARSPARPSWSATSSSTRTSRGARRPRVGAVTGKLVWSTGRGAFNPVISDGRRLYFLGYSSLFMLASPAPGAARRARPRPPRRRGRRRGGPGQAQGRQAPRPAARSHKRKVARRVAARRAAVRRNARLRRQHREICFKSHGRTVCRIPRPLVCVKRPRRPHGLPAAQARRPPLRRRSGGGWVCAGRLRLRRRRAAPPAAASSTARGLRRRGRGRRRCLPLGAVVVVSGWVVVSCGCVSVLVVWSRRTSSSSRRSSSSSSRTASSDGRRRSSCGASR